MLLLLDINKDTNNASADRVIHVKNTNAVEMGSYSVAHVLAIIFVPIVALVGR